MKASDHLTNDTYLVTYQVDPGLGRIRLDTFLKDQYRKRSREQLKRAIESGAISVRRPQGPHLTIGRLKPSTQLFAGDEVTVKSEKRPEPEVCFDYKVIYEDAHIFVIDKPANLPVHPAGRYFFNTLLIHLRTQGHQNPLKANQEYFLAHRIDKETSGILILAKESEVCANLVAQFAERKTEKRYLAIVRGIPPENFDINFPLKRAMRSLIDLKMMVAPESEGGQSALTTCKRLEVCGEFSVVECFPKTGRQHQIRIHLAESGHPIVGDKLYGMEETEALRFYERKHISAEALAKLLLPRHALHAAGIRFEHPVTGKPMEFRSELPAELQNFLDSQRTKARKTEVLSSVRPFVPENAPGELSNSL